MTRRIILLLLALLVVAPSALAETVSPPDKEPMPQAVYLGEAQTGVRIRSEMSADADTIGSFAKDETVRILSYEPEWLEVVRGTDSAWVRGYVPRHTVDKVIIVKEGALPYGALPATYTAVIANETTLRESPTARGKAVCTLEPGTHIAILSIEDGWAKLLYWRQFAYVYLNAVEELTPVYDMESALPGDTISAFMTFFAVDDTELNHNRVTNIAQACAYISDLLAPGQRFAFDSVAGPYQPGRGYLQGMSYYDGYPALSMGGGVCQVSSTLYNVLLNLPGGMEVIYRRAHGPSGATYLPHGVDAAVGNERLDLVFRNRCDFPVRIIAKAEDGVLFIAMQREAVSE